ncbi:helix-turn-helix transcriptional regulator [bacterium]|nr:helix-turn-helix transcriptional regulator [bacterium]
MEDLRFVRTQRGFSLKETAAACQVDPRRLSDYELGLRRGSPSDLNRVRQFLGMTHVKNEIVPLTLKNHRAICRLSYGIQVDPGPTWASLPPKYDDLYRQLNPQRTPDLDFRSKVRADSSQEPVGWIQLFEDGAEATAARPGWLDFPFHPLVDSRGNPIGNQLRAAFRGEHESSKWLLFPQLTLLLPDYQLYRPDGLLLRYKPRPRWSLVQLDGGAHRNEKWDRKQDASVKLPTLRFPSSIILGLNFAREFRSAVESL